MRQLLDDFDRELGHEFDDEPWVEATLRAMLASTYIWLGAYDRAEPHVGRVVALGRSLGVEAIAGALNLQGLLLYGQGKLKRSADVYRKAIATTQVEEELAFLENNLALVEHERGKLDEAEALCRSAIARYDGTDQSKLVMARENLSSILKDKGDYAGAEKLARFALDTRRATLPENHYLIARSLNNMAWILAASGRYEEAAKAYDESIAIAREALGKHPELAAMISNRADLHSHLGQYAEAEKLMLEALAIRRAAQGDDHHQTVLARGNVAVILRYQGHHARAEKIQREVVAYDRARLGKLHPRLAVSLQNLAFNLIAQRKFAEAAPLLDEALRIRLEVLGEHPPRRGEDLPAPGGDPCRPRRRDRRGSAVPQGARDPPQGVRESHDSVAEILHGLADILRDRGELVEADKVYRQVLAVQRRALGDRHPETILTMHCRSRCLREHGDLETAEQLCRHVLKTRRERWGDDHEDVGISMSLLGLVLADRGRFDEGERLARDALRIRRAALGDDHPDVGTGLGALRRQRTR